MLHVGGSQEKGHPPFSVLRGGDTGSTLTGSAALADADGKKKKKKKKKSLAVDEEQAPAAAEPAPAAAAEEPAEDAAKSSKKKRKKIDGLASPETVEVPVATMVLAGEGSEKKKKKKKKSLVEA